MSNTTKITPVKHNLYCKELDNRLNWMCSERITSSNSDIEHGYDYFYMLYGGSINCDSLKYVDEFVQHYHYGLMINSPMEGGDKKIQYLAIAIIHEINQRIIGSVIEFEKDEYLLKTPFFDFENTMFPLLSNNTILQVMLNEESVADYFCKLMEFHSSN